MKLRHKHKLETLPRHQSQPPADPERSFRRWLNNNVKRMDGSDLCDLSIVGLVGLSIVLGFIILMVAHPWDR